VASASFGFGRRDERVDRRVDLVQPAQHRLDGVDGGDLLAADHRARLVRAHLDEMKHDLYNDLELGGQALAVMEQVLYIARSITSSLAGLIRRSGTC
jgi:hypothetical protein